MDILRSMEERASVRKRLSDYEIYRIYKREQKYAAQVASVFMSIAEQVREKSWQN